MTKLIAPHILTACALLICLPFAGAEASAEKPLTVSRADLDLGAPEGARTLLGRIEHVARRYCVSPGYKAYRTTSSCTRIVMSDTIKSLGQSTVTAAWADYRRGQPYGRLTAFAQNAPERSGGRAHDAHDD